MLDKQVRDERPRSEQAGGRREQQPESPQALHAGGQRGAIRRAPSIRIVSPFR
jgi:hypothetical protein